jgi:hypothetical protein
MANRRPLVNVAGEVKELPLSDVLAGQFRGITIDAPTATEKLPLFFTTVAMTLSAVKTVVLGSATPSVTYTLKTGTDVSAAGTSIATGTTTSTTTGDSGTIQNSGTIAANSWVWLETSAKSGTVDTLHLTTAF